MKKLVLLLAVPALLPAAAAFEPVFTASKFDQPVAMAADASRPGSLYVAERKGVIREVSAAGDAVLLDIQGKVRTENTEEGLLGLAFHPVARAAGRYYAIYSVKGARPRKTRLSEFVRGSKKERVLLEVEKRWGNHNGATLAFGPDGYLYVSLGDGGSGGDPDGNAQNRASLLGKVLRIDVDQRGSSKPYAIPGDNPFAGKAGASAEVWAFGLRNPWRMAFDSETGKLWCGDVGQDAWEEIDVIEKGGNYGWNYREGSHSFKGSPDGALKLIEPVYAYGRKDGFCVIGGVVGRGKAPAWAQGRYLFADFGSKTLWSMDAARPGKASLRIEGTSPQPPTSFGTDSEGHIFVLGYLGGIFRLN